MNVSWRIISIMWKLLRTWDLENSTESKKVVSNVIHDTPLSWLHASIKQNHSVCSYVFVFSFRSCIMSMCRFFSQSRKKTLEISYENHISDIKRSLKWFRMCFVSSFFPLPKEHTENKNLNYKQITSCLVVRLEIQMGKKRV